jgi:putative SOS response-associated peptidase YedK
MAAVHNRMPVILDHEQELPWLSAAPEQTESLLASLAPLSENQMELYPVSRRVNWAGNDGPDLVQPA